MDQLDNALIAAQKLAKKLRQLVNRGEATAAELGLAEEAVDSLRRVASLRGEPPVDIDGRRQKRLDKQARQARARENGQ